MSKTIEVKHLVRKYLSDGNVHEVADIKNYVKGQYGESATEGIISGAIRTMVTSGIIENVERGRYRIITNNETVNSNDKSIRKQILELTQKYEESAISIINSIEIKEENMDTLTVGIRLRKKIEKLCDGVRKELH